MITAEVKNGAQKRCCWKILTYIRCQFSNRIDRDPRRKSKRKRHRYWIRRKMSTNRSKWWNFQRWICMMVHPRSISRLIGRRSRSCRRSRFISRRRSRETYRARIPRRRCRPIITRTVSKLIISYSTKIWGSRREAAHFWVLLHRSRKKL